MQTFKEEKFNIPKIDGISQKQIDEHLKLYQGYVKHSNKIIEQIKEWEEHEDKNSYNISELRRRFSFEFDGMRSHEYYFGALEDGPHELDSESSLAKQINKQFGGLDDLYNEFVKVATTRGSGWCMLYWDKKYEQFVIQWIDEHHLGHLSALDIVLAVDVWEHAFMVDYLPGEKKKYLESYWRALNWEKISSWFDIAKT